ncbi:MAG: hypothetical protein H0W08_22995 [Acidobacteria bacterium]|nr:hypothetical protein [Acidobacteriota bacterium]
MMDDRNPLTRPLDLPEGPAGSQDLQAPDPAVLPSNAQVSPATGTTPMPSAANMKFKSCRWRCDPEAGEFCTHRDVLPFAGKEGFVPESWCPDCAFYKLRRTPKKRDYNAY